MSSIDEHGGWPGLLTLLLDRHHLTADQARAAMSTILAGDATPAQLIGFVVALRAKGESAEELSGLLDAVLAACQIVPLTEDQRDNAVDIVGTGGDHSHSINVSTMAAIVVAAAGVPVCKHGARAASSKCGAADVLEALGVVLDLTPEGVKHCVDTAGIGFCFAPSFHPAFRFAAPSRREIGVPTVFNLLGPMANPGRVRRQVIGVANSAFAERMIETLKSHGSRRAWVVHGGDLDELSTTDRSRRDRARPRRGASLPRRPAGARAAAAFATRTWSVASRRRTPSSSAVCWPVSAGRTATSSCSMPVPGSSSPGVPPTSPKGRRSAEHTIDSGAAAATLDAIRGGVARGGGLTSMPTTSMTGWVVRVPASSANLGAGFDVLGMALGLHARGGCRGSSRAARAPSTSIIPQTSPFGEPAARGRCGCARRSRSGRGLGFSGAARVGGAAAAAVQRSGPATLDDPTCASRDPRAHRRARGACRQRGGVDLRRRRGRHRRGVVQVPLAFNPMVVVWVPDSTTTSTDHSRAQLPDTVSRADAVFNVGRAAMFVAACANGEVAALRAATEDRLHQQIRLERAPESAVALEAARRCRGVGRMAVGKRPDGRRPL